MCDDKYKAELKHSRNDGYIVSFKYDNIELIKNENFDMFSVSSIITAIENIIHKKFNINGYLTSFAFYQQLMNIDESLPKYGFVYLLILNKENKICKIGRTFDIVARDNKKLMDSIELLIPVEKPSIVKKELIKAFSSKLTKINEYNDIFQYDAVKNIKNIFKEITDKYKVDVSYKQSEYIKTYSDDGKHDKLYVTLPVCEMIFNSYVKEPEYKQKFETMKKYIIDSLHEDVYISNEYNTMLETNCMIWKFHKYMIIQNDNDLYINGSKLWESIIEGDNLGKQIKFSKFLKSRRVQQIKERFEKLYPNQQLYRQNMVNKTQPYFSGTYIHYVLAHFIILYVNAEHASQVSELLYKRYHDHHVTNTSNENIQGGNKSLTFDEYNMMLMKMFSGF